MPSLADVRIALSSSAVDECHGQLPNVSTERLELLDVAESTALQKITVMGDRLRILIADGCDKLEHVDVTNSANLQHLSLARVSELKEYPVWSKTTPYSTCKSLKPLPYLISMDWKPIADCEPSPLVNCLVDTPPNWRRLIQMTELTIYGCRNLTCLPEWHLPSLEVLKIGGCDRDQHMIPFSQFPNLQELKWTSFKGLEETTDISSDSYETSVLPDTLRFAPSKDFTRYAHWKQSTSVDVAS